MKSVVIDVVKLYARLLSFWTLLKRISFFYASIFKKVPFTHSSTYGFFLHLQSQQGVIFNSLSASITLEFLLHGKVSCCFSLMRSYMTVYTNYPGSFSYINILALIKVSFAI